MTKKDLETKVINAQATVAKKKAIIEKHRTQLAKLTNKGADPSDIRWNSRTSKKPPRSSPRPRGSPKTGRTNSALISAGTPSSKPTLRK